MNAFVPFLFAPLILLIPASLALRGSAHGGRSLRRRTLRVSVLPPVFIFLILHGYMFMPRWRPPTAMSEPSLAIDSFDTWAFSHSADTLAAVLGDGAADVIALQEIGRVSAPRWPTRRWTRIHTAPPTPTGRTTEWPS